MIHTKKIKQSNITFYSKTDTEVDGQIVSSDWTENLKCGGIVYRGSIAKNYVSDTFKSEVEATIILDYHDYTKQINEGDKVIVQDFGTFSVMFVDNVGNQNRIISIPCKEYTPQ